MFRNIPLFEETVWYELLYRLTETDVHIMRRSFTFNDASNEIKTNQLPIL